MRAVPISIDNEKVALFVLGPEPTLSQVNCVNSAPSLQGRPEEFEKVIVISSAKLHLLSDAVQIRSFVCSNYDDLTCVFTDFNHRKIKALDKVDQRLRELIDTRELLLF